VPAKKLKRAFSLISVLIGLIMFAAMLFLRHNNPNSSYLPALKSFWLPISFWGAVGWYVNRERNGLDGGKRLR
jgi:hypothetical protein